MKLISFLCLLGIFTSLFSCKSREYPTDNYEDLKIIFGSGGGFTGMYTYYSLLENGQIFEKGPQAEGYTYIGKTSRKKAASFFGKMTQFMEDGLARNTPGNMNYFVKLEGQEKKPYELQWAAGQDDVDSTILELFHSLNELVPKEKP